MLSWAGEGTGALDTMETTVEEYLAQARRCRRLSDEATDPRRMNLYRRMERGYLMLAETQEELLRHSPSSPKPGK